MKRKKISAIICATVAAALSAAYAGCVEPKTLEMERDESIAAVYQSYIEAEAAAGNEMPLTYEAWLDSIKGDKGDKGEQGKQGERGEVGATGKTGEKGDKGDDGSDGKSAYQIWLDAGNKGTEADFIKFLKGEKGDKGVKGDKGDKGDEGEKGDKGDDGTNGTNGINGVSVIGATVDERKHLIIKLSDGNEIDAGYVGAKQLYHVTFIADDKKVAEVEFIEGDITVTEPQVPHKEGYTGSWEKYTLKNESITVNAVYTPIQEEGEQPPPEEPVKPEEPVNPDKYVEYVINVTSAGGLKLNGIEISVYDQSGTLLAKKVTGNGKVAFELKQGEYTIKANPTTLPEGYYLSNTVYTTSANGALTVDYKIPSKVSSEPLYTEYKYEAGNIARDFTVTDVNQNSYSLSRLSQDSKAVFLFFFNSQNNIEQLKMLNDVSSENTDAKVLAICQDGDVSNLQELAQYYGITIPLIIDSANLVKHFDVAQMSTIVVIDRYGRIPEKPTELITDHESLYNWLETYTSDSYVQKES